MSKSRELLIKRRDALRKTLDSDLRLRQDTSQLGGDVVDVAIDSLQKGISWQLAEVESHELAQIENALKRMRDGSYGVCEGCKRRIPPVRLEALPYATSCIDCQREAERRDVTTEDTTDYCSHVLTIDESEGDVLNEIARDVTRV